MSGFKGLTIAIGTVLWLASGSALALDLPPRPPKNPLSERPEPLPKITCENFERELAKLKTMSSDHNQSLASYMDEVIVTIEKWYNQLVAFEDKSLPKGELAPIKTATKEIADTQNIVWENMATLDSRFDELLVVLPSCLKAAPQLQKTKP